MLFTAIPPQRLLWQELTIRKIIWDSTSWHNAPDGKIVKADVSVAKNYLSINEIQELNEIVTMYLDYATRQARRHIPMTMADWASKLDAFLQFNDAEILHDKGKVTAAIAKALRKANLNNIVSFKTAYIRAILIGWFQKQRANKISPRLIIIAGSVGFNYTYLQSIDQLAQYAFFRPVANAVHATHPFHLIGGFEVLRLCPPAFAIAETMSSMRSLQFLSVSSKCSSSLPLVRKLA